MLSLWFVSLLGVHWNDSKRDLRKIKRLHHIAVSSKSWKDLDLQSYSEHFGNTQCFSTSPSRLN